MYGIYWLINTCKSTSWVLSRVQLIKVTMLEDDIDESTKLRRLVCVSLCLVIKKTRLTFVVLVIYSLYSV